MVGEAVLGDDVFLWDASELQQRRQALQAEVEGVAEAEHVDLWQLPRRLDVANVLALRCVQATKGVKELNGTGKNGTVQNKKYNKRSSHRCTYNNFRDSRDKMIIPILYWEINTSSVVI